MKILTIMTHSFVTFVNNKNANIDQTVDITKTKLLKNRKYANNVNK